MPARVDPRGASGMLLPKDFAHCLLCGHAVGGMKV